MVCTCALRFWSAKRFVLYKNYPLSLLLISPIPYQCDSEFHEHSAVWLYHAADLICPTGNSHNIRSSLSHNYVMSRFKQPAIKLIDLLLSKKDLESLTSVTS